MSSKGANKDQILVVGIGNPLRADDGVGAYVAESIEAKRLSQVKVWVTQQLHVEDLEPMLSFGKVILVDAAIQGQAVDWYEVKENHEALQSSHHLSAQMFVNMARDIYHKDLKLQVCSIRGHNFNIGDKISPQVMYCAHKAIDLICSTIGHS